MATSIDIASSALILIGDEPISSIDESKAASSLYQEIKEQLLSSHPWSFATKQQQLNRLSESPDEMTGYSYAFQLPTDLIRIWSIQDYSNYILVGDKLYSNSTTLLCTYIYDAPESSFPPHFIKALQYALASDFAVAVREDMTVSGYYENKARFALSQATAIDSQSRPQISIIDSPLLSVRY